jgi:phosphohistidine phosphatase
VTTLLVMRHAKSAYPVGVPDHDRPLNPRGTVDAVAAGSWIRDHVGRLDHVIVSSARRTRETWTLAAGDVGHVGTANHDVGSAGPLVIDPRVYDATAAELVDVLRELPESVGTAVLVGHNPGCEDLVRLLARESSSEAATAIARKYPTSGIAVLDVEVSWPDLGRGSARLVDFVVPRG